jgi:hypothetical protein
MTLVIAKIKSSLQASISSTGSQFVAIIGGSQNEGSCGLPNVLRLIVE